MGSKNKDAQAEHERGILDQIVKAVEDPNLDDFYGFTYDDVERLQSAFQSLEQNPNTTFPISTARLRASSSSISRLRKKLSAAGPYKKWKKEAKGRNRKG